MPPFYKSIDVIVSVDAFEHYPDPERELRQMWELLKSGGELLISFGPPWWHPNGCHMMPFGAPPWAHILFKEPTILEVRSLYRSDGAKRFEEIEGGLNRMTVRRFKRLVQGSGFFIESLTCIPIRRMERLARNRIGCELFTSVTKARLVKP